MIEFRSVSFVYGGKPRLFDDLELKLEPDNIYGLLGRNGAGKTTLLRLICGLAFPLTGEVRTLGFDPVERDPAMLGDIFHVPEEFDLPPVTIGGYGDLYAPFYPAFDSGEYGRLIDEFGLSPEMMLSQLSFGQKKKVLIAFGLSANTRVLLLDEPTNGLDIPSKGEFRRMMAGAAGGDRIILISTHQVRDLENLINPVIILENGRVLLNRTLEEISGKISMERTFEKPDTAGTLYCETSTGGYLSVTEKSGDEESGIDIEVLFNAVVSDPGRFERIFSDGASADRYP